jgi:DNA repair exonuclease SbcCD nuclease subunit
MNVEGISLHCSDFHLDYPEGKDHRPPCRLDSDWIETQRNALGFILKTAKKEQCVKIYIHGDIFNQSKVPPVVSNMFRDFFQQYDVELIAGNHDLKYGNIGLLKETSIYPFIHNMPRSKGMADYGQEHWINEIMFLHTLTFKNEKDRGMAKGVLAQELLDKFPEAKWIFTGDNHRHFHYEKDDRHVINPGCILRFTADLIDYQPVVYIVNTLEETVQTIDIPDDLSMITDGYLRKEEEREDSISAFIEKVQSKTGLTLSFTDNLKQALKDKNIEPGVISAVKQVAEKANILL